MPSHISRIPCPHRSRRCLRSRSNHRPRRTGRSVHASRSSRNCRSSCSSSTGRTRRSSRSSRTRRTRRSRRVGLMSPRYFSGSHSSRSSAYPTSAYGFPTRLFGRKGRSGSRGIKSSSFFIIRALGRRRILDHSGWRLGHPARRTRSPPDKIIRNPQQHQHRRCIIEWKPPDMP